MSYVKASNGVIEKWPYSLDDLRSDNPNVSFPAEIPDELLEDFGVYPVVPAVWPSYDAATHKRVEMNPEILNGWWIQQWSIVELTLAEKAGRIPKTVKMRQARIALFRAGLLSQVSSAIAAMTGDVGEEARIEWEYADEVSRDSVLVQAISSQLNISEQALDELFITATEL